MMSFNLHSISLNNVHVTVHLNNNYNLQEYILRINCHAFLRMRIYKLTQLYE